MDQLYVALKENIITTAMQKLTENQVKLIVEKHTSVINSKRRCSYIRTLGDLTAVLEKRCHLSKDKVDFFIEIANILNDSNVNENLGRYRNFVPNNNINENVSRSIYCTSESSFQTRSSWRPQVALPPEVMRIVCRDIGTDWKELVRELRVAEGDIDIIEAKHPKNLREQIREGMKLVDQNFPPETKRQHLVKALNRIGRRDLRERVEEFLLSDQCQY